MAISELYSSSNLYQFPLKLYKMSALETMPGILQISFQQIYQKSMLRKELMDEDEFFCGEKDHLRNIYSFNKYWAPTMCQKNSNVCMWVDGGQAIKKMNL